MSELTPEHLRLMNEIPDPLERANQETPPVAPPVRISSLASAPTRAAMARRHWIILTLSVAWLVLHLLVFGVRPNLGMLSNSYVVLSIVVPLVLGMASVFLALRSGPRGLGSRLGVVAALALGGPLGFLLIAIAARAPIPFDPSTWDAHLLCFDLTLLWMSVPLLLAGIALHERWVGETRFRGGLLGAGWGLLAAAVMNLHCESVEPLHVVMGHAVPVWIAGMFSGWLLGRLNRV